MESYEQMVARINASAFLIADDDVPTNQRKQRRAFSISKLTQREQRLLVDLLNGTAKLVVIAGAQYAVRQLGEKSIVSAVEKLADYVVEGDRCTCPDSKFREHACKHAEAVRALVEGRV